MLHTGGGYDGLECFILLLKIQSLEELPTW